MEWLGIGFDWKFVVWFVMDYLRYDGVFMFRFIGKNFSDIVVVEIVFELWDMYWSKKCI